MTQPGATVNGGAGIVNGPDGKAYVVIAYNIGGAQIVLPPMPPDEAARFAQSVADGVKERADEARRHNMGLIVPANGNGHRVTLDPADMRRIRGEQ